MGATGASPVSRRSPRSRREKVAYLFFHRPGSRVPRSSYERALIRFHGALARHPTPGFVASVALRLSGAPWKASSVRPLYLDWYVVEGFQSLDPIRVVAYRPPWVGPHRFVARLAADGWGSLYAGSPAARLPAARDRLVWFASSHPLARSVLDRAGSHGRMVWRRQLALGPSPEFCWPTESAIPPALSRGAVVTRLERLFPTGRA
jgi:hypothetical protein